MPTTDELKIDTKQIGGGVIVSLTGSASMELCDQLNAALFEACGKKPETLVVDLSRLDFICSLGLGGLVAAYLRQQNHGGRLAVAAPNEAVLEVLNVTRLGTLLPVFKTSEAALKAK